jgi:hypothetical protein
MGVVGPDRVRAGVASPVQDFEVPQADEKLVDLVEHVAGRLTQFI